jgi:hypothetical protein
MLNTGCSNSTANTGVVQCDQTHTNKVKTISDLTAADLSRPIEWNGYEIHHLFNSLGEQYGIDQYGVIHQLDPKPFTYDAKYVSTYDTPEYQRQSDILQALRLGFVLAAHGNLINSLCDFGYGNGAFLKFIKDQVPDRYGIDVTGIKIDGCTIDTLDFETYTMIPKTDVMTFWDALEHVPDPTFVRGLECETVAISLPWCHYRTLGKNWFDTTYYHRKPNEHLHHFDAPALKEFMKSMGWRMVAVSRHEDIVRVSKTTPGMANILTMAFKR